MPASSYDEASLKKGGRLKVLACSKAVAVAAFATFFSASAYSASIYEVVAHNDGNVLSIAGTVVPKREVTLAAQQPGRVALIAGQEGEEFKQDAILLALDETTLRAKRAEAEAVFREAQAALQNAQIQYRHELINPRSERATSMPGMGMPGMMDQMFSRPMASAMGMENSGAQRGADLHQQGSQMAQAEATVERVRAQIEQIDAQIRDSRSIAPFAGVILEKLVETGDTVQPGKPLLKFADLTVMQVKALVPARLTNRLSEGQKLNVSMDSHAKPVPATVAQIFPAADARQHTVAVKFDLPVDVKTTPGSYVEVLIPNTVSSAQQRLQVPRAAVSWRGALASVKLVGDSGATQLRYLRVKDGGDAEWVEVYNGLNVGDKILLPE